MTERSIVAKTVEIRTAKSGNEFLYIQDHQKRGYSIFDKELWRQFEESKATKLTGDERDGGKFFDVTGAEMVKDILKQEAAQKLVEEVGNIDTRRSALHNATNLAVARITTGMSKDISSEKVVATAKVFETYLETGE